MNAFPDAMLNRLEQSRVVAGFSIEDAADAVPLANALLEGGIDCIELMLRTDSGIEAVRRISANVPGILLGVGTILRPDQVVAVKDAGAHFGVSPGLNTRVIQAARAAGLPFAPGICTPTDLEAAIELGCHVVKFFPAESCGGIDYLTSMAAPYRHLGIRYFPLGGVNADNMKRYLKEDIICAVGGSWIVKSDLVKAKNWDAIRQRAADVRNALDNL